MFVKQTISGWTTKVTARDWAKAWLGTTIAGGIFGMLSSVRGLPIGKQMYEGLNAIVLGGIGGLILSGTVGVLVTSTAATLCWIVFINDRIRLAFVLMVGGVTGLICSGFMWPRCVLVALLGSTGAVLPFVTETTNRRRTEYGQRRQFGIRDLIYRTTAIAVLVVVWRFLYLLWENPQSW
jgi:hypothetical protein